MDGQKIIDEARTWIGTPFYHTGRERGVGVDCCGLLICVLNTIVGINYDNRDYSRIMPNGIMRAEVEVWCDPVCGLWLPGDVILFSIAGMEQHVGFYAGNNRMIHSYQGANTVAEHIISPAWRKRIVCVYRLREGVGKWQH